jgi:hypothetical protein
MLVLIGSIGVFWSNSSINEVPEGIMKPNDGLNLHFLEELSQCKNFQERKSRMCSSGRVSEFWFL